MAIELVEIVNPNGRKGVVAATSDAAKHYPRPPSADSTPPAGTAIAGPPPVNAVDPTSVVDDADALPALNASTEIWRDYATSHGLSSDEADAMTRDELVDHFKSKED